MNVNLDRWRWLRKISGLDTEAYEYYSKLAQKNEALIEEILYEDAHNIYIPKKPAHPKPAPKSSKRRKP